MDSYRISDPACKSSLIHKLVNILVMLYFHGLCFRVCLEFQLFHRETWREVSILHMEITHNICRSICYIMLALLNEIARTLKAPLHTLEYLE